MSIALSFLSLVITLLLGLWMPDSLLGFDQELLFSIYKVNIAFGLVIIWAMTSQLIAHHTSITDQLNKSNKELEKSLAEKDVLLAEVHHRVKNNLAIISSLMHLQLGQLENDEAREILVKNSDRLRSMSMVHNNLYSVDNFQRIDFRKIFA